jgi:uncharacterized spore protein YtfJ
MKKIKIGFLALSVLLWGISGGIHAQPLTSIDDAFANLDKMMAAVNVDAVIGDPIQIQDTIIVPFSKISYGLGAGGAMMGFGGGMGAKTIPLGILIIEGEDVRVELFPVEEKKPSFLQEMLPVLLRMLPEIMGNKFSPPAPSPEKSKAKTAAPPQDLTLGKIEKLYEEKKYQEALDGVDALISADSDNAELHAWKGSILGTLAQGDNPADMIKYGMGAMREFETALKLDPNNVRGRFGRAVGRLMAPEGFGGDVDGAIEDLEIVCKKDPSPDAFYYLGKAYQKKGIQDKAKKAFQEALVLKPDYKAAAEALEEIK